MKHYSLLIFHLLICNFLFSQEKIVITGIVQDSQNKIIPYSDILLTTNNNTNNILAFTIANAKGKYKISFNADIDTVRVEASSMGFKKNSQILIITPSRKGFELNFTLQPRTEEIAEVEVTASPKAIVRNDTTIFNIQRITNGSERVVEDILKKLPGLEVKGDGKLQFKGKDVTNVLLDGDDLFGQGYTMGTKNIKAGYLSGVEAVENYSKNPLLRGLEITNNVAINLKFKSGLSLSNAVELGYGHKERYNSELTSIAITKKVKAFSLLNYNNLGNNTGQNHFVPGSYLIGLGKNVSSYKTPAFLETSSPSSLFNSQNSDRNNAFFGSINVLPHISETSKILLNMDYFSDKSMQEKFSRTLINTDPNNPIIIEELKQKNFKPQFFNGKVAFEKFFSKKSSIENITKFSRLNNSNKQSGTMNNVPQAFNTASKEFFVYNNTEFTHRININNVLKVETAIAMDETPEELYLMPGINYATNSTEPETTNFQDILSRKQSAKVSSKYYHKSKKGHKLNVDISANYFKSHLNSSLQGVDEAVSFNNIIDYDVFTPGITLHYAYKYKKLEIRPLFGLEFYNYSHHDIDDNLEQKNGQLLLDARLNIKYDINRKNSLYANIGSNQSPPNQNQLYNDFILTSNRLLQNNILNFDPLKIESASINYQYNNMLKDFSAKAGFSYHKSNRDYQSAHQIMQDVSYQTFFLSDKGSSGYSGNAGITTFIPWLRSRLMLNSSYNTNNYYNMVNATEIRKNKSKSWHSSFNFETNFIWKFVFTNVTKYVNRTFYSQSVKQTNNESLINKFTTIFKPSESIYTKAILDYHIPSLKDIGNSTLFLDAFLEFNNKKKTLVYRVEGKNLLNQKSINVIHNGDYYETTRNVALQERYVLFSVGFRF